MFKAVSLIAGFAFGVIWAGAAQAGIVSPPLLLEIANVPLNDTLNLRAGPSGSSADIGDLDNGDLVEVLNIQGNWGMIGHGEGDAWISLSYAKQVVRPVLSSGLPVGLGCSGTEPFWSLNLLKLGAVSFDGASQPILQSGVSRNSSVTYFFSTPDTVGILRAQQCSDGMSDRTYGWQIDVVSGQGLFSGCCSTR